jgi:hypothetical protein
VEPGPVASSLWSVEAASVSMIGPTGKMQLYTIRKYQPTDNSKLHLICNGKTATNPHRTENNTTMCKTHAKYSILDFNIMFSQ